MDGRRSIARIGDVVNTLDADVVCYQEVHRRLPWSGWGDQVKHLGTATGMQIEFLPTIRLPWGGYGIAIGSRLPIISKSSLYMPSVRERRGLLTIDVDAGSRKLRVCCTHLGLSEDERVRQIDAVAEVVNKSQHDVILMGDFNERANGGGVRRLLDRCRLSDAGAASDVPTYPSDTPTARIDFVFYSAGLNVKDFRVVETQASDHLPVVVEV